MSTLPGPVATAAGGFRPLEPTTKGGPDYGRFIAAVRTLQDHARAADAPDEVFTRAAEMIEAVNDLLAPYWADECSAPSNRREDLPNRGNVLWVPMDVGPTADGRVAGTTRFARFHQGRNGAAHGGAVGLLFDTLLGMTVVTLTGSQTQRTAYLHIDYRRIALVERELQVEAGIDRIEGRKIFVTGRLLDDGEVLAEARALFVRLRPGQP